MKIHYFCLTLPSQKRHGGDVANESFVLSLRRLGHDVCCYGYLHSRDSIPSEGEYSLGYHPIRFKDASVLHKMTWVIRSFLFGTTILEEKFKTKNLKRIIRTIKTECSSDDDSFVIVAHHHFAWIVQAFHGTRRVLVEHNIESVVSRGQAMLSQNLLIRLLYFRDSKLLEKSESNVWAENHVWVLTDADKSHVNGRQCKSVSVIPPCPIIPDYKSLSGAEADAPYFAILGNWGWEPNRIGLDWFMTSVADRLEPGIRIVIGGPGAGFLGKLPSNMHSIGFVKDHLSFLCRSRGVIIPSTSGGGIQMKSLEAISLGVQIISTSFAMRGIDSLPDYVCVVDDPTAMAKMIHRFWNNPVSGSLDRGESWLSKRIANLDKSIDGSLRLACLK